MKKDVFGKVALETWPFSSNSQSFGTYLMTTISINQQFMISIISSFFSSLFNKKLSCRKVNISYLLTWSASWLHPRVKWSPVPRDEYSRNGSSNVREKHNQNLQNTISKHCPIMIKVNSENIKGLLSCTFSSHWLQTKPRMHLTCLTTRELVPRTSLRLIV